LLARQATGLAGSAAAVIAALAADTVRYTDGVAGTETSRAGQVIPATVFPVVAPIAFPPSRAPALNADRSLSAAVAGVIARVAF